MYAFKRCDRPLRFLAAAHGRAWLYMKLPRNYALDKHTGGPLERTTCSTLTLAKAQSTSYDLIGQYSTTARTDKPLPTLRMRLHVPPPANSITPHDAAPLDSLSQA